MLFLIELLPQPLLQPQPCRPGVQRQRRFTTYHRQRLCSGPTSNWWRHAAPQLDLWMAFGTQFLLRHILAHFGTPESSYLLFLSTWQLVGSCFALHWLREPATGLEHIPQELLKGMFFKNHFFDFALRHCYIALFKMPPYSLWLYRFSFSIYQSNICNPFVPVKQLWQ